MFGGVLVAIFIASCSSSGLEFNSTAQVDDYFGSLFNGSQLIELGKAFDVLSRHTCSVNLRILISGSVYRVVCVGTNCSIQSIPIVVDGTGKEFVFHNRDNKKRVFLRWSNGSHHTLYNDILPHFEFENFRVVNKRYREKHLYGDQYYGYFDFGITWDNHFLRGKNGIVCLISNGNCNLSNPTFITIRSLPARTAISKEYFTAKLMVAERIQGSRPGYCSFRLPPVRFSAADCPLWSTSCKPPCKKPDNVMNATYAFTNDTLIIRWLPSPGSEYAMSYIVRWGPQPLYAEGSSKFPLEDTQRYRYFKLKSNQSELSVNISAVHVNSTKMHAIAVQIVALCKDKASILESVLNESDEHNVTQLNKFFEPARKDVTIPVYHPEGTRPDTEGPVGHGEALMISSQRDGVDKNKQGSLAEIVTPVVVVSTLALIVIAALLAYSRRRRKIRRHHRNADILKTSMQSNPFYHTLYVNTAEADRWEITPDSIEWGEEIGYGAFGSVFKCSLLDENFVNEDCQTVAVKTLTEDSDELSKQQFIQEILVMKELEDHPNILQLIGCVTSIDPVCLILEYAYNGDLLSYLQTQKANATEIAFYENPDLALKESISYTRQLQMALDIAVGMEYISSKGYVHRDLAARNLLLDSYLTVKIADFGLTRYLHAEDVYVVQNSKRLPVKWLSIEALSDLTFSTASDIWAFGVVLFELFSLGETPYPTIDPMDMLKHLVSGKRMERPTRCTQAIYGMMMDCWQAKPSGRPTFAALHQSLTNLYSDHTNYASADVDSMSNYSSVSDGFDSDEGFVPSSPHQVRAPLTSESSNFSDVSMIVSSPEFKRKSVCEMAGERDGMHIVQHEGSKNKDNATENSDTLGCIYETFHYQM